MRRVEALGSDAGRERKELVPARACLCCADAPPLPLLASLSLPIVAVAKAPEPVTLTQLSDCYMLQYKAPSLTPEARAKAETECKACLSSENKVKPGQRAQFALTVKDESTAKGACTTKAVAVIPTKVQTPGSNAAFRCAALFEDHSSECQKCVNGGGALVEWPEGKTECASKPKGLSLPPIRGHS